MIPPDTVQKILDATRIEEVLSEFVSLHRRGASYWGCCPFHNEKTPSFSVSPSRGIFKCFGCGEGGNAVHFLMKHEHFSYPDALRFLANKYGIEIKEKELTDEERQAQTERDTLFHVSEFAQKHFADLLYNNEDGRNIGLAYFYERQLSDDIIKKFGLGYCLDEWEAFTKYALSQGYSEDALVKSGLSIMKEGSEKRIYDRFRGRVMFPIFNASGRVLGFSGRVLTSEKTAAKYVNSPDSEIYNNSNTLYGIFQAKSAISRQDLCYLVEGNIDVISMHQAGLENTIASCGTSLTKEQIRMIKRYTRNVTLMYDGDPPGVKAAIRAIDLLLGEGMRVRVVLFPDNDDPDSYAKKYGSEAIQNFVKDNAIDFVRFKTGILLKDAGNDPLKISQAASEMVNTIALVGDLMERTESVHECASMMRISEDTIAQSVAKAILRNKQKAYDEEHKNAETAPQETTPPPADETDSGTTTPITSQSGNQFLQSFFPCEEQEKKIIEILLSHGNDTITQPAKDEDGKDIFEEYYVATLVIGDILNDNIKFDNPLYQSIFDEYEAFLKQGSLPPDQHFVNHPKEDIRLLAATLLSQPYSISEKWYEMYNISTPSPDDPNVIANDLHDSMLNLKMKKLEQKITELKNELDPKNLNDPERERILLGQITQYENIKKAIGKELNRVIT
ncbi:MAG: DNA primase [Bacteroidales bacterium]|nr:DNA primase [Bacteroidales bacterium]